MTRDYESVTRFVRERLIAPGLDFNHLDTTRSAINSIIYRFRSLGWNAEQYTDSRSRIRHHVVSPDGMIELSMNGAKVFRHPMSTEQICQRKHLTKKMLELDQLPTPTGADFSRRELSVARSYFQKIAKPAVVKPTDSGGSHGVTVGVSTVEEFEAAWKFAIEDGGENSNILIEEFVRGVELRALVIGSEAVSVVARIQPFVVGDGIARLDSLINASSEARKVHYRATQIPVVVNWEFIRSNGYSDISIPSDGEIVYLNPLGLPAYGALLVDITETVCSDVRDLAVRAKSSIPGLEVGGVDILVDDIGDASTATILEVNTAPSLNLHRYATHGQPRAVDLDVVDYFNAQYLSGRASV